MMHLGTPKVWINFSLYFFARPRTEEVGPIKLHSYYLFPDDKREGAQVIVEERGSPGKCLPTLEMIDFTVWGLV